MTFRVRWTEKARDELAAAWLAAAERAAVTAAAHRVDQLLAADPEGQGESRPGRRRIMFESPLAVTFRVDADQRQVVVVNVRAYRTPGGR